MLFKNILVPVDFSEASEHALALAVRMASAGGGSITLMHVGVVPHFYATELGMTGPTSALVDKMSVDIADEQRARLTRLQASSVPADIPCSTVLREGFPPEEVLHQINQGGHDLLVMGTHGRTGIKRALLGSVTERVVRDCRIPVMVTH